MSANDWQSPLPPPPTWDANALGFGSGDGGRQGASWTGRNASGKGFQGNVMPFMEISDRDPIPTGDFQEPGARFVKSTSPDTENHDKNGYAKIFHDNNLFMTNVDNYNSDTTYTNKHKNTEHNVRDMDE